MKTLGKIIVAIALIVISVILRGYIIAKFWGWFLMPIFNVDEITIGNALGLSVFVGIFTYSQDTKRGEDKSFWELSLGVLIGYLLFLLFGWLLKLIIY